MLLAIANYSHAKEWRGITPLHSTLADVVREFGTCTTLTNDTCTYALKEETIKFVFLSEPCGTGVEKLARQTIVRIERRPKIASRLPDYHKIDFYHFSAFTMRWLIDDGFELYVNDAEGFAAEAKNRLVTQVHYTATAEDLRLCPSSYVKPSELLPRPEDALVFEFLGLDVTVSCPDKPVGVDKPVTFSANVSGGFPYMELTYSWLTSAGTIIGGQGTPSILIETKGLPAGTEITATLTIGGIPVEMQTQAACTSKIRP
jgi:hypothetical protein